MLGLGGASLAVSAAVEASPIVPLFSGRESKVWRPEHASLTRSHLVLTRPKETSWTQSPTPRGALLGIQRLGKKRWPIVGGMRLPMIDDAEIWSSPWRTRPESAFSNIRDVKVLLEKGDDPHEAFYRAAMKMRDEFATQSRRRFAQVPEPRRPYSLLVTLVDTPIFAGPLTTPGPYEPEDAERGFYLEISYTPHLVENGDLELNGWGIYSENGEYPIEVPTDVDFDRLLTLDRLVLAGDADPLRFAGKLISAAQD